MTLSAIDLARINFRRGNLPLSLVDSDMGGNQVLKNNEVDSNKALSERASFPILIKFMNPFTKGILSSDQLEIVA